MVSIQACYVHGRVAFAVDSTYVNVVLYHLSGLRLCICVFQEENYIDYSCRRGTIVAIKEYAFLNNSMLRQASDM